MTSTLTPEASGGEPELVPVLDPDTDTGMSTAAPDGPTAGSGVLSSRPGRNKLGAFALAALVLAGGFWFWTSRSVTNPAIAGTTVVTADELESVYGAHIDMVALLAEGGLLELRFRVIDKDKAQVLFGNVEDMPKLAIQDSDVVLESGKGMGHKFSLVDGGAYFLLYGNPGNVVHKGTVVSFVLNGYRIPDITVQK